MAMCRNNAVLSLVILACFCPLLCEAQSRSRPVFMCYYTTWASQRAVPSSQMFVKDIDPHLCTHIILAFAAIDADRMTIVPWNPTRDLTSRNSLGLYDKINRLKIRNPKLLTLLAIGGITAGSRAFRLVSQSPISRMKFVSNVVRFLRQHDFDGLDVDWEFPSYKDGTNETFTLLLQDLMGAFRRDSARHGMRRLRLSVAVSVGKDQIDESYEVDQVSKNVDFINLMAYDFAGSWSTVTGFNSPLYPRTGDLRFDQTLCQEWAVNYWIQKGAARSKLVLGIATSGKSFTLDDRADTGVGAKVNRTGIAGRHMRIPGVMAYLEMCQLVGVQAIVTWDDVQKVPYAYWGTQWVGYDNPRSVAIKTEWMLNQSLGGAMVWTLSYDDFRSDFCKDGKFPLTRTIKKTIDTFMTSLTTTAPTDVTTENSINPSTSVEYQNTTKNYSSKASYKIGPYNGFLQIMYVIFPALYLLSQTI